MRKNDEFDLVCTDLSDQGFGIGHHEGMTVFVSGLLPEEKARVHIVLVKKDYAIGKIVRLEQESADRVTPSCDAAARCGGCSLMHLRYPAQLEWKAKGLRTLFGRVDPSIQVLDPIGMDEPYYYRNKAQFPIAVKDGKIIAGFYRPKSNTIVPIEECKIENREINAIFGWLIEHLDLEQARELRHLFIRFSPETHQGQVVLIGRKNVRLKELAQKLHEAIPALVSIVFNQNTRDDNVILGDDYTVLYGSDSMEEGCMGLKIRLHFKSFFQVNPQMTRVLYAKALEFANLKKTDRVIELYSGTGTIGLLAAREAKDVTGVEIVPEAVENARANQQLNGIESARFVCEDASVFARQNENSADVVFVDPPRKGMSEQGIEDIVRLSPRTIVYISCNPRTLARDLKLFQKGGYRADVIQPVDMFSHTAGMECVARLQKEPNA